jgi:hypothetical protein
MGYTQAEVEAALTGLDRALGCRPARDLQLEYEAGLHPTLLSYDKVELSQVDLPVLVRYFVGATSYLHQPANYYNIFGTCRCVTIVQFLNSAVDELIRKEARGLSERLQRLRQATRRDAFDAVAFELITAAEYARRRGVEEIEFLAEDLEAMTPDFAARGSGPDVFVECKKIDRTQQFAMTVRNAARDRLNPVLGSFRSDEVSVLIDVTFHQHPTDIEGANLLEACRASLSQQTAIIERGFTVLVTRLPRYESDNIILHPSPEFWWKRYGYKTRSEWIGVVSQVFGQPAYRSDLSSALQSGMSSWLNDISWDSAAKWKTSSEDILKKYRRFAFDGIFRGLEQLESVRADTALHVWLESDYYTGVRAEVMKDLFERLAMGQRHRFSWLVINETLFDVSPKGRFDFIEHAHAISGPTSYGRDPRVFTVFVGPNVVEERGEFGVGVELPDIDAE